NALYWCDITSFLEAHVGEPIPGIPVSADNKLDSATLESKFKPAFREVAKRRSVGQAVLNLASADSRQRVIALMDCFGSVGQTQKCLFYCVICLLSLTERNSGGPFGSC